MTTARDLLASGPDGYTAARDAAVKERRAAGDRAGANDLKGLTRPGIAMWAVLAAGADEAVARAAVDATSALADVQGASSSREQLVDATRARREAVEAVVDAAVAALASHGDGRAADRRDEVRSIVDRLSRHPDVLDAWLDATLRDLPDDDLGFGAFSGMAAAPAAPRRTPAKQRSSKAAKAAAPEPEPQADAAGEDAAREAAIVAARQAVADAEAAQGTAEHRLREAERQAAGRRKAEEATAAVLEAAQRALDDATARHQAAAADAEAAGSALAEATAELAAARARHEEAASALAALRP